MSLLVTLHQRLGIALVVVVAAASLGALVATREQQLGALRAYVRCSEIALLAQAGIGLVLVLTGRRPHDWLHWLYGAAVLAALPVASRLSAATPPSRERWLLAGGGLAAFLLGLRAVLTGG